MASETFYVEDGNDDCQENGIGTIDRIGSYVQIFAYTDPDHASYRCGGFRFPNITIPKGSNVTAMSVAVYCYGLDDPQLDIYGNNVDDANDFLAEADVIQRAKTIASVEWKEIGVLTGWKTKTGLQLCNNPETRKKKSEPTTKTPSG